MFNTSDLIFISVSLALLALSYLYFKRTPTPKTDVAPNIPRAHNGNTHQVNAQNNNADADLPQTKADMLKEARKREKKEQKEAQRREVERIQKMQEEKLAKIDEAEEKERLQEEKEAAALAKLQEEQRKKEEEEYNKWKDMIEIEAQGTTADDESKENLLARFIEYIQLRKVVEIEDLAVNFKLANKSVIQRIKDLEASGVIQGVLDDRGKYIYITKEEIEGLLACVENKGRLTRADMITEFSKVVRLEPREEDLEAIKRFEGEYSSEIDNEFKQLVSEEMAN